MLYYIYYIYNALFGINDSSLHSSLIKYNFPSECRQKEGGCVRQREREREREGALWNTCWSIRTRRWLMVWDIVWYVDVVLIINLSIFTLITAVRPALSSSLPSITISQKYINIFLFLHQYAFKYPYLKIDTCIILKYIHNVGNFHFPSTTKNRSYHLDIELPY